MFMPESKRLSFAGPFVPKRLNAFGRFEAVPMESEGLGGGGAKDPVDPSDDNKKTEPAPKPSDTEAKLLREVMEKKDKLATASTKLKELEAQVAKYEGLDPDKAKAALEALEEAEQKKLEAQGDFEKLKAKMAAEHEKALAKKDAIIQGMSEQLASIERQTKSLTIGQAFTGSKFIHDDLILTPSKTQIIYGSHFDVVDGDVVAFDKPAGDATRSKMVDAKGRPLSFDEALRRLVEEDSDRDSMLKAKIKPGADSRTTKTVERPDPKDDENKLFGLARIREGLKGKQLGVKK